MLPFQRSQINGDLWESKYGSCPHRTSSCTWIAQPPRSSPCFHCNQVSQLQCDYYNHKCFNCGRLGHISTDCWQQGKGPVRTTGVPISKPCKELKWQYNNWSICQVHSNSCQRNIWRSSSWIIVGFWLINLVSSIWCVAGSSQHISSHRSKTNPVSSSIRWLTTSFAAHQGFGTVGELNVLHEFV